MVKRDFGQQPMTEDEIINCYWYAVVDDTIGGWAIGNVDESIAHLNPYEGEFELCSFLAEYEAKHIADIHNKWYQDKVSDTYKDNYLTAGHNDHYLYAIHQLIEYHEYEDAKYMATYVDGVDVTKLPYWPEHVKL